MRLRLPKDPTAPLLARVFVRRTMCERHSSRARDEVELLVSELVTNAVVHGGSLVTLELDCDTPEGISVSVSDSSSAWPVARRPDLMDEDGRGMWLVELISDAWGVREAGIPAAAPRAPLASVPASVPATAGSSSRPTMPGIPGMPRQAQGKAVWFRLAG